MFRLISVLEKVNLVILKIQKANAKIQGKLVIFFILHFISETLYTMKC